jgi:hypothetical protein
LTQDQRVLLDVAEVNRKNVFEVLSRIRSVSARRPVIVFDQLDDYQTRHSKYFVVTGTARLISQDELCEANEFWGGLAALLTGTTKSESEVHAVLSIRTDAKHGLTPFRFVEPVECPIDPILGGDALHVLDQVLPTDAVQHPDNGFSDLKKRLVRDLGDNNGIVLPIRLRVAIAGLDEIRDCLTPAAYDRLGGVPGLEAGFIRGQICKSGVNLDRALRLLMVFVVNEDGVTRTRRELSRAELTRKLFPDAEDVLERLEQSRILVRKTVTEHGERWSLYHDYLGKGIDELDRRDRHWIRFLDEHHNQFRLNRVAYRWRLLLTPRAQSVLWWERARGRIRFTRHRAYVALSLARIAVNWLTLSVAVVFGWYVVASRIGVERSMDRFEAKSEISNAELQEFWEVTTASDRFKDAFQERLLSSQEGSRSMLPIPPSSTER